ncbi:MAG TPA: PepSY-associated TM helix domain-containing protein [Novosphingobium sp.]|nr:PepSY-associated TM helix domain-containing protein [Novosphingobium sp.]
MKVPYHPFIPRRWQSHEVLKWLKRTHAWSGLWGALLFLGLGISGFLLNHRAQAKIDTGEPIELAAVELPVAPGTIRDAEALGRWAERALRLPLEAQPPKGPTRGRGKPPEARFAGREVAVAEPWTRTFAMPDARVTVDYVAGSNHVTARREEVNALGVIKNLHKGLGLPVAWVLLIDTIAGALIVMALTGFLLWSRLHGPRLLAGALVGGSLAWALAAAVPAFG